MVRKDLPSIVSKYTLVQSEQILSELGSSLESGLSEEEAKKRLNQYGSNELRIEKLHWWQIALRQYKSPFIYLLLGACVISLFLRKYLDSLMILLFVFINGFLGFLQEFRSEQALKVLKSYFQKRSLVLRAGSAQLTPSSDLVPGDIVLLSPGDMVPADIRILESSNLTVDESVLTGESAPTKKIATPLKKEASDLFKAENLVFSATTVVAGKGKGIVIATGQKTVIGNIAHLTVETARVSSFAKGIGRFSKFILYLTLITLVFVLAANIFIKGPRVDIPELLIFTIALAVSVIPEALPVVTTFSLSRGALILAKSHVVVKRLSAIEDLGGIEVLCTDKTGTLTENALIVDSVYPINNAPVILYASLASPFLGDRKQQANNAFDLALQQQLSEQERGEIESYERIQEVPFDPVRRRNSVLLRSAENLIYVVRGAPEDILPLSKFVSKALRLKVKRWIREQGFQGKRIIAVAKREVGKEKEDIASYEKDMTLVGFISFVDPLKKTAIAAVKKAKNLGVKIKILTGDSPEVAGAVAYQIGLIENPRQVVTGWALEKMTSRELKEAVENQSVFARVSPQQKFTIIERLQEHHEVGYLGEGINDAPALKVANVALVVQSAADIAREAADIVLLQKSLNVVVDGIQEGRRVFANTVKYIKATLSSNFGNFYAVAIASLLIDSLPMLPLQILLVNLLSDFPTISISTDAVDQDELKSPKTYNVREIVLVATLLGIVSSVFDFIVFGLYYRAPEAVLQTNWFIASILTELVFLFSIRTHLPFFRSKRPSFPVVALSSLAFILTLILPYTAVGREVFLFRPPLPMQIATIASIVVLYFTISEIVKLLYYRLTEHSI